IQLGAVQANVGAGLPSQQRMLLRRVVAGQQDRRRIGDVAHRSRGIRLSSQRRGESREVGCAMVVDVVGSQYQARELLQQVVLFVRGAVGSDYSDRRRARCRQRFFELRGDEVERLVPLGGNKLAIFLNQRSADALAVV